VAGYTLNTGTSEQPLPDRPQRYAQRPRPHFDASANSPLTQTGFGLR